ncbi:MAG: RNA polymerase sigma factor [Planctomycetota bacterium]
MKEKIISANSLNTDDSIQNVLLKRAIYQRDKKAIEILYSRYYPSILRYIASRVGYCVDVEDLAQDVFIELCKSNGRYNGQGNIEEYLFGIARNGIRRYYREKANSIRTVNIDSIDEIGSGYNIQQQQDPVNHVSAQQLKKRIRDTLDQLPPKAREAIRLRFIEGLSSKAAAKRAGCHIDTFYHRFYEGLKALRNRDSQSIS